jgi:glycosyltransferase involved in cell wall biosynthesis
MKPPLVSCIVPVYNGERFLGEALDSILAQSYEPLEVLVVDDGSTDGTPEVAASYGDRICYMEQSNAGPAAARNRGVEASRGEFLAFLDADDLWVPDKTAKQVQTLRDRPELDFCVGHIKNFFMPERQTEAEEHSDHPYHQLRPGFSPCALLVTRSTFASVGGFDPDLRLGEDTDWFIRAFADGCKYQVLPDLLVDRRLHSGNTTLRMPPSHFELIRLLKSELDRRRSRG